MPWADVAGGLVAQSRHPPHGPGGAGTGCAATPFPSGFPGKGWSNLGSGGRKRMLSSDCARLGSVRDAGTVMTVAHFWFSTFYALLLAVLPAVEKGGGGNSLPHHPFPHRAGQGTHSTGQADTPVTWGRPGPPRTGQAGMRSTRREGQAEQNRVVPLCRRW